MSLHENETRTVVYGASDDLIEIEGHLGEEFAGGDEPVYLGFANGVVLRVAYNNDGIWEIRPRAGFDLVTIEHSTGDEGKRDHEGVPDYSDKAVILNAGPWVVVGDRCEVAR